MPRNKIEQLKLNISKMLNEEQQEHAQLLSLLSKKLGTGSVFTNIKDVLDILHKSKVSILEEIYKSVQEVD